MIGKHLVDKAKRILNNPSADKLKLIWDPILNELDMKEAEQLRNELDSYTSKIKGQNDAKDW